MMQGNEIKTYPDFDFALPLKALPIKEVNNDARGPQLILDLIRGERVGVHLNKDDTPMYLHVNAAERCLHLYDDQWLIAQQKKQETDKEKRTVISPQSKPKKRPGKNKGRSL